MFNYIISVFLRAKQGEIIIFVRTSRTIFRPVLNMRNLSSRAHLKSDRKLLNVRRYVGLSNNYC